MKGEHPIWFKSMDSNSPPLINNITFPCSHLCMTSQSPTVLEG